jgi:hypothetical protein
MLLDRADLLGEYDDLAEREAALAQLVDGGQDLADVAALVPHDDDGQPAGKPISAPPARKPIPRCSSRRPRPREFKTPTRIRTSLHVALLSAPGAPGRARRVLGRAHLGKHTARFLVAQRSRSKLGPHADVLPHALRWPGVGARMRPAARRRAVRMGLAMLVVGADPLPP